MGVVVGVPRSAFAGDDDAATLEMARQRFQEGVRYFDAKQYDRARAAFLQAYALKKHPTVLLNLAQSELRSAHDAEAADHFSEFLRENKDAGATERQSAEQGLAAAKTRVAEVSLAVDLPDAEVFVDNDSRGHAPLPGPVYLSPGTHTLQARKEGKLATSTVTASAGQSVSVALNFSNAARTTRPVEPAPLAERPEGPPHEPAAEHAAPHHAVVEHEHPAVEHADTRGFGAWYASTPGAWVLTGVTAVGVGAGIAFAVSSNKNYADADSVASQISSAAKSDNIPTQGLCVNPAVLSGLSAERRTAYQNACSKYLDNVHRGDTMKTYATVSFVVGGAAAVGTVVYYFVDRGSASSTEGSGGAVGLRVSPAVAPGFVGIAAVGRF